MSHVDEGALHAYLDGALDEFPATEAEWVRGHVESCAECADRLEAERRVRADAEAMLGLATPSVDMPSLEELRTYVKRTRPERPPAQVRLVRMGWAASVVLAVGAGWMLRGGQLQQAVIAERDGIRAVAPAAPRGEAGAADATGFADGARDLRADEAGGLRGDEATAGTMASTAAVEADRVAGRQEATVDELEDRRDLPASVVARTENPATARRAAPSPTPDGATQVVGAAVAAREQVAGMDADRSRAVSSPDASNALAAGARASDTATGLAAPMAPPSATAEKVSAPADQVAALPPTSSLDSVGGGAAAGPVASEPEVAEERPAERRLSESLIPLTSALNQSGRGSVREVSDDDRFNDEPSQSVPGFEVLTVTNLGVGTAPEGVLIVQRLEEGALLEIYHLAEGVSPDVLPSLEPTVNEVRVEAETGWVVMRGPRSEDELEVLLARLFPR